MDLQIVSFPYTILLDPIYKYIHQATFSSLNVSLFRNYFSVQIPYGCILKQTSTKVLADSTCGMNKKAGTGTTAKCIATAWESLGKPC